jgi:hypothetical protein
MNCLYISAKVKSRIEAAVEDEMLLGLSDRMLRRVFSGLVRGARKQ